MQTRAPNPLSALSPPLAALAARGVLRRYRKGTLLIHEGDRSDLLFIVTSGRVKAFSSDDRDREIVYGVYGPGDYFGEMSLDGGPRSASVITLETTQCVTITRITLYKHIAEHPDFAFELLSRVIRRARLATQSARSMALLDVYARVVNLLNELSVAQPDGTRVIAGKLTHAEIASRVGCSREMVSRLMKSLERGEHISRCEEQWVLTGRLPANW